MMKWLQGKVNGAGAEAETESKAITLLGVFIRSDNQTISCNLQVQYADWGFFFFQRLFLMYCIQ